MAIFSPEDAEPPEMTYNIAGNSNQVYIAQSKTDCHTGAVIAMACLATLLGSPKTPMYFAKMRKL